jgi:hypothetical protein
VEAIMIKYQTKLTDYDATEDLYNEGEVGSTMIKDAGYDFIEANSLEELLKEVNKKLYINDEKLKNICHFPDYDDADDGTTCFEVTWTENIDGNTIDWNTEYDKGEIERWKKGEVRFWSCRMLIHVAKVTKECISEDEINKLKIEAI